MSANLLRSSAKFAPNLRLIKASSSNRYVLYAARTFHIQCKRCSPTSILLPSLSPTMTAGAIKQWVKQEGDAVSAGDVLLILETDKAEMELESDEDGVLAKIIVPAASGVQVPVGQVIGVLAEEGEDWRAVAIPDPAASSAAQPASTPVPPTRDSLTTHSRSVSSTGPSVRKLLEEFGVSPDQLKPTGPHGRIVKGDVLEYIKSTGLSKVKQEPFPQPRTGMAASTSAAAAVPPPPKPVARPGESFVDIPHTNMRKIIAKRLTESKSSVPHTYASIACDVGSVTRLRKDLKSEDIKVSVNDFIIKAAAVALQRVPQVNVVWQGDTPQISSTVDISIAVATDNGLITPIVKNAAFLGVEQISFTVKEMATRARAGKLQPREFQGGSFSISNLGMFGVHEFTAVINPPQSAILAVGTSRLEPGLEGRPRTVMTVQLSYDGRVIDHTEASRFLETFRDIIESPSLMLSGHAALQAAAV